jgi:hypothetical protein
LVFSCGLPVEPDPVVVFSALNNYRTVPGKMFIVKGAKVESTLFSPGAAD